MHLKKSFLVKSESLNAVMNNSSPSNTNNNVNFNNYTNTNVSNTTQETDSIKLGFSQNIANLQP